jgi:DNA polymerase-2
MALWVIESERRRLRLLDPDYTPCFYLGGPHPVLRRLASALAEKFPVRLAWTQRQDLWSAEWRDVLEVGVRRLDLHPRVVRWTQRNAGPAELFNCDIQLPALYAYEKNIFPLARCRFDADLAGRLRSIELDDDPWATDYELPPLRVMEWRLEGEPVNPHHGYTAPLELRVEDRVETLAPDDPRELLRTLARALRRYDPDVLLTDWGDSFLLPRLLEAAERFRIPLPLNRDPARAARRRPARSYFSYGRIVFKDSATTLAGRLHIDRKNSFVVGETNLDGLFELARVSKLPLQYQARTSTGTGITSMQLELALRQRILIPWQKREPEEFKSGLELLRTDRGGLVFQPVLGFHENVGELDFASMFPSIMARFNVSPETVNCRCGCEARRVPEIGYRLCDRRRGLVPQVVEPLVEKRRRYKLLKQAAAAAGDAALRDRYDDRQNALKWLLVTCFGYLGYKNARFGRIEAHEAINAFGRDRLLTAKEISERAGFRLLHAIVDSLWVVRAGAARDDYAALAREIEAATGLPVDLAGVYDYIVFLPSRENAAVPVPNRYFGVFSENPQASLIASHPVGAGLVCPEPAVAGARPGRARPCALPSALQIPPARLKVRGLEVRRHDAPPIVARMQEEVLKILAEAHDATTYREKLAEAEEVLRKYLERLRAGKAEWAELVIRKRLTQYPRDYRRSSHVALAAQALDAHGVRLRPGEIIEYVITDAAAPLPADRVKPFTLVGGFHPYDAARYAALLESAFAPFRLYIPSFTEPVIV